MKKWIAYLWMTWAFIAVCSAQSAKKVTILGNIMDGDDKSPVIQATVQLLSLPDSTMVTGNLSDLDGHFKLMARPGRYVLKVSYVGYKSQLKRVFVSGKEQTKQLEPIVLKTDAVLLKEAVVTAQAAQVSVMEDSTIFNAAAFRTPQGAMLEELVKKLPGAEVDDDGNIKINGKEVKKIMMNGKEFFGGDVKTGMKNLPVDMIDKLKTYDKKSDLARITGIDDGEEETVLDLTVKKGMNQGWFGNLDVAGGSEERYLTRGMVNYFKDQTQFSIIASGDNVNGQGFSGGGGAPSWRMNKGLNAIKNIGANFATENDKIELGGSVQYNYSDADVLQSGYAERFLQHGKSFSNSNGFTGTRTEGVDANFRLEWKPDSMTNIIFRPNFSWNYGSGRNQSQSGTFNEDPLTRVPNPNDYLDFESLMDDDPLKDIRVNASNDRSTNNSRNLSGNGVLQLNRKLNSKGRNLTFRGFFAMGESENNSYSDSETRYYEFLDVPDSTLWRKRFMTTPGNNWKYSAQMTYSEPIARATFLQFSYKFDYSYKDSKKSVYSLENLFPEWNLDAALPDNYLSAFDEKQSKDAEYKTYTHEALVSLRFLRKKFQLNVGLSFQPQRTNLAYKKGTYMTDTTRNVFNFAPKVNFRYRFSKTSRLFVDYKGRNAQPGMENLLPIVDDANPLNIRVGNPGLKPAFNHNLRLFFNTYEPKNQTGMMVHAAVTVTQNAISQVTQYNERTGGTITTPDNINGNWNAFAGFNYNTALKNKKFTINTFTSTGFNNRVSLLYNRETKDNDRNKTTNMSLGERVNGSYRNNWFELSLNGSIRYVWERSDLRPENNQEPYNFSYGASTNITLPWQMTLATNITNQCRRGYTDTSMNRNELIWNAQIAQNLFKGAATVSFEMYDILKNKSNIMRSLNAQGRNVYTYNGVNSYCMVHFIYRLNAFSGKKPSMGGKGYYHGGHHRYGGRGKSHRF